MAADHDLVVRVRVREAAPAASGSARQPESRGGSLVESAEEAFDRAQLRPAPARIHGDYGTAIPGIPERVAKVMVSLPDDLLEAVDIEAERRGTSRSGFLRELAEECLRRRTAHRAERMAQIDVLDGPTTGHGGRVADLIKANRPER